MNERIITLPSGPDVNMEIPKGWYLKRVLSTSTWGKPASILITDDPQTLDDPFEGPKTVCGVFGRGHEGEKGLYCTFEPHHQTRHSWEPEDPEDKLNPDDPVYGIKVERLPDGIITTDKTTGHLEENRLRDELRPEYYQTESGLEPWDVIKAFRLDYWRGNAVAYLLRCGRKPGDSGGNGAISDIRKAYTFLGERLRMLEEEAHSSQVVQVAGDSISSTRIVPNKGDVRFDWGSGLMLVWDGEDWQPIES